MREGKLATIFCSLLTLVSTVASAPKELYGKSVTVQGSESLTGKLGGEQLTRNVGIAYQMNVYVSTAGRSFVRLVRSSIGGFTREGRSGLSVTGRTVSQETAPGQASARDYVNFEGRSIVVYREFESGARRIAFDC
jgi:hypothetical protein